MRIIGSYSFKGGDQWFAANAPDALRQVIEAIERVDAGVAYVKESYELTTKGSTLYSPRVLNTLIKTEMLKVAGWMANKPRVNFEKPTGLYVPDYAGTTHQMKEYVTGDFYNGEVVVEVQFGKYAFLWFDTLSKMVILKNRGLVKAGIEIAPSREMVDRMSSGIGSYEKIVLHLKERGAADLDLPIIVLGIEPVTLPAVPPKIRKASKTS